MRSLLCLFVLATAALACPTGDKCSCSCGKSIVAESTYESSTTVTKSLTVSYPKIIPECWKVLEYNENYACTAFSGFWYVQIISPTWIKNQDALRTGFFSSTYPCSNPRVFFQPIEPSACYDFSKDYYMILSAFNEITRTMETTVGEFKAAYDIKNSKYAIFNVATQKSYSSPIKNLVDLIDDSLICHPHDKIFERDFTVAVIDADAKWEKYVTLAVVNTYDNVFCGNSYHSIITLTREQFPDCSVYKDIFNGIEESGFSTRYLMSVDQSIDFNEISTVSDDEINGVFDVSTLISKSVTIDSSTVEVTLKTDFTIMYEFGYYDVFGDYPILKGLTPEVIREVLSGDYFVYSSTPCLYDESDDAKVGIFYTSVPACSLQVMFDKSITAPWDYKVPTYMLDRAYNMRKGVTEQTRSIISSTLDSSNPWGVFTVYSEGYGFDLPEICPLVIDGCIAKQPCDLYNVKYDIAIAGYKPDCYTILLVGNKYKNLFYGDEDQVNQCYVLSRNKNLSQDEIDELNQDLCRIGYNPHLLARVDQTYTIPDEFVFDSSYFEYTITTEVTSTSSVSSSGCGAVEATYESSSSTTVSTGKSCY